MPQDRTPYISRYAVAAPPPSGVQPWRPDTPRDRDHAREAQTQQRGQAAAQRFLARVVTRHATVGHAAWRDAATCRSCCQAQAIADLIAFGVLKPPVRRERPR